MVVESQPMIPLDTLVRTGAWNIADIMTYTQVVKIKWSPFIFLPMFVLTGKLLRYSLFVCWLLNIRATC